MKAVFCFSLIFALLAHAAMAARIQTQVFVKKIGGDNQGNDVELATYVKEFGNGQGQSFQSLKTLPKNKEFSGKGKNLGVADFGGPIPTSIGVRVTEDDGTGTGNDDGVCELSIATRFSKTPVTVTCVRSGDNGLKKEYVITAVDASPLSNRKAWV